MPGATASIVPWARSGTWRWCWLPSLVSTTRCLFDCKICSIFLNNSKIFNLIFLIKVFTLLIETNHPLPPPTHPDHFISSRLGPRLCIRRGVSVGTPATTPTPHYHRTIAPPHHRSNPLPHQPTTSPTHQPTTPTPHHHLKVSYVRWSICILNVRNLKFDLAEVHSHYHTNTLSNHVAI